VSVEVRESPEFTRTWFDKIMITKNRKTVVIGVSTTDGRVSKLAVERLIANGHDVFPLGKKAGKINGMEIILNQPAILKVETISMYIRPELQIKLYSYILELKPKRIIFNPGTENAELKLMAEEVGIETLNACTLTMLALDIY